MILKRLRFGFRSLLLFVLLLSLVLGYYSQQVQSGRRQLRVLEGLNEPRIARYARTSRALESKRLVSTLPTFLHWLPLSDECVEVEGLECSNRWIRAEDLAEINKLSGLKRLALWSSKLSADDFEALDRLQDLELLDVHFCPNIDQDELLAGLDRWPKLRKIVLGNWTSHDGKGHYPSDFRQDQLSQGVTSRGLRILAEHPLKPVDDLKVREFTKESLDDLNELRRLETLEVELGHRTGPEIFNQLYLPHLRHLVIVGVNAADLTGLKERMPSLKVTFRPHSHVFENLTDLLENLPRGIKLEEVDTLCLSPGNGADVKGFGDRSELNFQVWIKKREAVSPDLTKYIKRLCIKTSGDEEFFDSLKGFKNLDQLSLWECDLSNSDSICQLHQLSHLSFQGCVYTDLDLKHWPQLKSLTIDPTKRYDDGNYDEGSRLIGWDQLTHLRRLHISGMTSSVYKNLEKLPNPEVLEELIMGTFGDSEEKYLQTARFPNLKTLVINHEPPGFEAFADQYFPDLSNFDGRTKKFDPAERRFTKAFAPLRDGVEEEARKLEGQALKP